MVTFSSAFEPPKQFGVLFRGLMKGENLFGSSWMYAPWLILNSIFISKLFAEPLSWNVLLEPLPMAVINKLLPCPDQIQNWSLELISETPSQEPKEKSFKPLILTCADAIVGKIKKTNSSKNNNSFLMMIALTAKLSWNVIYLLVPPKAKRIIILWFVYGICFLTYCKKVDLRSSIYLLR